MKKLVVALILLLTITAHAQHEFETYGFAMRLYDENSRSWEAWTEWKESKVIIIVYTEVMKIKILSERIQEYDINHIGEIVTQRDGSTKVKMKALDEENIPCTIEIISFENGSIQFYIRWSNLNIAYEAKKI
jgi:hypothetical protein